uniref:Mg-protoporphyrin IX chelatase n=1 Tax=Alexandrium catenella TaxID=2925 RepID=A0A7S1LSR0_ALECA|mmetsp:Transcript_13221/g.36305  ORF Transcript_13221/g.36305 Transcript_13221/m.36305 type:complete len:438 (+) Transcript_13221:56-1369(+)|eukprot:CAMPEP_0171174312 /NCGR_PEP_ID=MMETSP0790-20130122/10663_1 /TAXON_ID=2925 /ORGANISM="Alexandrium catenella, Strain OF101" /LENGTH=437 /DNA_ID=CAMNT_0011639183 /DNA_START=54 /DNA_END=1367 /DNA_ORIENTATION=-
MISVSNPTVAYVVPTQSRGTPAARASRAAATVRPAVPGSAVGATAGAGATWAPTAGFAVGAVLLATQRGGRRRARGGVVAVRGAVAEAPARAVQEEARPVFPFSAIVGQAEMKLSLILNVIDPKIGGVMIMGDRGTGKTTTIRALVDLLPEISCIADDPYNSSPTEAGDMSDEVRRRAQKNEEFTVTYKKVPMVDLPLGATEDRVCGTIDIEKALTQGKKAFEPGLLAKANRGILYVDEVNLLDDHLVDVLLDSAAGGWNTVEREGISIRHPAKFILVGSGNPEEGELRPQLLDRFGMHALIKTESDPELRVKIVDSCQDFADDPKSFRLSYEQNNKEFADTILAAQGRLKEVTIDPELRTKISRVCSALNIDGLRGDIVTNRAARSYCAFDGRTEVTEDDIRKVMTLCLRHRLRKDVLDTMDTGDKVQKSFDEIFD